MTQFKRKIVDWCATGVLVLIPILVLRASLARGTPSGFDEALLRITAPLQAGVSWVVEGVGGLWGRYVAVVDVEAENRELRAENEKLRRQLAEMTRRAFDVNALEDLAVVKRKTPADTLARLSTLLAQVLGQAEVKAALGKLGAEPGALTPAQFGAQVSAELASTAALVRQAGIKAD